MKISGRRINVTLTRDGSCHKQVKKSLKKTVTRLARRRLNAEVRLSH